MGAVFEVRDNQGTPLVFTDQDTTIRLIAGRKHWLAGGSQQTFTYNDALIEPGKVFLAGGMANMPDVNNINTDTVSYDALIKDNWQVEDGRITYTCDNNDNRSHSFFVYIYSRT